MDGKKNPLVSLAEIGVSGKIARKVAKPICMEVISFYEDGNFIDERSQKRMAKRFAPIEADSYSIRAWTSNAGWYGELYVQYYCLDKEKLKQKAGRIIKNRNLNRFRLDRRF